MKFFGQNNKLFQERYTNSNLFLSMYILDGFITPLFSPVQRVTNIKLRNNFRIGIWSVKKEEIYF